MICPYKKGDYYKTYLYNTDESKISHTMTIYTNARLPPHRTEMRRAPFSMIKPSSSRRTNFHCNGRFCRKLFLVFSIGLFVFLVTTMQMDNYDIQKPVELDIAESKRGNSPVAEQTSGGNSTHQKKKILAWTKIFGKDFLIYDKRKALTSDHAFSQCPVYKNCEWTIERSALEQVDAVVFHIFPKDFSLQDLPAYRNPAQNWVFLNLEPPQRFQGKIGRLCSHHLECELVKFCVLRLIFGSE